MKLVGFMKEAKEYLRGKAWGFPGGIVARLRCSQRQGLGSARELPRLQKERNEEIKGKAAAWYVKVC